MVVFLMQVDVGNFLRLKSCVLYTELENPDEPLINVEVVAHVTQPELRSSEVSTLAYINEKFKENEWVGFESLSKMIFRQIISSQLCGTERQLLSVGNTK